MNAGSAARPGRDSRSLLGASEPGATSVRAEADGISPQREELLQAAFEVLARSGWRRFKVAAVVQRAGVSTRSFYDHFESKEDVLLAMILRGTERMHSELSAVAASGKPAVERLTSWIDALLGVVTDTERAPAAALLSEHTQHLRRRYPQALHRRDQQLLSPLVRILDDLATEEPTTHVDAQSDATAILALVSGLVTTALAGGHGMTPDKARELTLPFIWRALGIRPENPR